jgi:penicillin-binding protein 2
VAILLGGLVLAFFRIQVVSSGSYALRAESNRLRPLPVPAPRGTIFDRNGRVMADNTPGYSVTLLPSPLDSITGALERMAPILGLSEARIARLVELREEAPRQPLLVDPDVPFDRISQLEERRYQYTNLFVEMRPRRRYEVGPAAAHVLGYVGEITADELRSPDYPLALYQQGMLVGRAGVERQYELLLQGRGGVRTVEVDARGRIVGDFAGVTATPATPGRDIRLNVDLDLQEWIHHIFPDTLAGAVVALDPHDGGVLALYSAPAFDPNDFVGGIDSDRWAGLRDSEDKPLFNRAVQGTYAPASTWKLAAAAIALDLGVVGPHETMAEPCDGGFQFGNRRFRCWDADGHGNLTLIEAIQHSCDVYFYQLGLRIGLDRLLRRSTEIGFSNRCGIDLPGEARGTLPADRQWWVDAYGYPAQEGEVLSLAIGQGPNDQTPLKMAQFYMALARDGSAPAPLLRAGAADAEALGWELNLQPASLDAMLEGLRRVTGPEGTAYLSSLEHWDLYGKTGTGQNSLSVKGLAEDHAWFAGMAGPRGGEPEIVVVVLVEFGGGGSSVAAPLAAKTADFYLRGVHGIPRDTLQTLGEHLRAGAWPAWAVRLPAGGP